MEVEFLPKIKVMLKEDIDQKNDLSIKLYYADHTIHAQNKNFTWKLTGINQQYMYI